MTPSSTRKKKKKDSLSSTSKQQKQQQDETGKESEEKLSLAASSSSSRKKKKTSRTSSVGGGRPRSKSYDASTSKTTTTAAAPMEKNAISSSRPRSKSFNDIVTRDESVGSKKKRKGERQSRGDGGDGDPTTTPNSSTVGGFAQNKEEQAKQQEEEDHGKVVMDVMEEETVSPHDATASSTKKAKQNKRRKKSLGVDSSTATTTSTAEEETLEKQEDSSPKRNKKKHKHNTSTPEKQKGDNKSSSDDSDEEEEKETTAAAAADAALGAVNKKKKTRPPVLQVMVHRIRCLSYRPRPIICLKSVHFDHGEQKTASFLAVARDDGSVQLKSATEKFRTVSQIAGQSSRPVQVLCWIQKDSKDIFPTCIGGSVDGTLFVLDWQLGLVKNVIASGGGGVLSLATIDNFVAAGCEDGSVRIYKLSEKDKLELVSTIPMGSVGGAVLSLAWTKLSTNSSVLFAGLADGTIRRYDLTGSSWKSSWRITVECLGRSIPTRVWSLLSLHGGATVVSGDSLGHVQFWDGQTGTLLQSCDQSDLKTDVLCLVSTPNDNIVFASGVDSRVICIEQASNNHWILTNAQRPHTHDVKGMAICKTLAGYMLCSGGVDTKLCSYPTTGNEFRKQRPKIMYPWPAMSPIAVAKQARLLILQRTDRIDFFPIAPAASPEQQEQDKEQQAPKKRRRRRQAIEDHECISTLEIKSSNTSNLVCSDISKDGSLLVTSNAVEGLMLFQLQRTSDAIIPTKMKLPSDCKTPCVAVKFLPSNRLACATTNGPIVILGITKGEGGGEVEVTKLHTFFPATETKSKQALFAIHALHVSHDGNWLVSCQNGSDGGAIQIYSIMENGTYKHWWTLPKLEEGATSVGFMHSSELAVSCVNSGFYIMDIADKKLSSWSEAVGYPVTPSLPPELMSRNDYPVRFACNKATPKKLLMGSFGAFCAIDLDKPMPRHCRIFPERHVRRGRNLNQRKHDTTTTEDVDNCTICLRYNSMIYMDFVDENELLVVEQPWLNVVATFPEALERKVYGAS